MSPNIQYTGGPLTTERRNFFRKSQCGVDGKNPLVCCPNTFTVNDLPKSCGKTITDKIYGGENVDLNEFPWYEFHVSMYTN